MHVHIRRSVVFSYMHQGSKDSTNFDVEHWKTHRCTLYIYRQQHKRLGQVECLNHTMERFQKKK